MNTSYFQAVYSNLLDEWSVREVPSLERVADFPTRESAESFALASNEWLASRPSPDHIWPFFSTAGLDVLLLEGRASEERLNRILDNALAPEIHAEQLVNEYMEKAA